MCLTKRPYVSGAVERILHHWLSDVRCVFVLFGILCFLIAFLGFYCLPGLVSWCFGYFRFFYVFTFFGTYAYIHISLKVALHPQGERL